MASSRIGVGYALVVLAALSFAANTSGAVLAYRAGATPVSVITFRLLFTLVALYAVLRVTGGVTVLPRRQRNLALGLGVLLAFQSWSLLAAIETMPVALAILAFYLYPMFIGIGSWMIRHERLSPALLAGLAAAFAGLGLALDVTTGGMDTLGVVLAVSSAAVFAVIAIVNAPLVRELGDSRPMTLYMHVSAAAGFVILSAASGSFALPGGAVGWIGFLSVPVTYTIAITAFFAAAAITGPVRASLVMNLEPVASIVFGFVILGQVLTPLQLVGSALVIAAVLAVKLDTGRRGAAKAGN